VTYYRLGVVTNLPQVSNYVLKLLRECWFNKMYTFSTRWIFISCL
jgi:hypothetical protein